MERLSRRRLLKISTATFGAGTVGFQIPALPSFAMGDHPAAGKVETIATHCEMCGAGAHQRMSHRLGGARKILEQIIVVLAVVSLAMGCATPGKAPSYVASPFGGMHGQ
jgi:hypothetical protein